MKGKRNRSSGNEYSDFKTHHGFLAFAKWLDDIRCEYVRTIPPKQSPKKYPKPVSGEDYLITHLKHVIENNTEKEPDKDGCLCSPLRDGESDNPRVGIPSTIQACLRTHGYNPPLRWKKPISWLVCYVHNTRPEENSGESLQCSHRCLFGKCCTPSHLVWETASYNQGRGYKICQKLCSHCGDMLCECQELHDPPCIHTNKLCKRPKGEGSG